jgi:hypothetical protein
MSAIAGQQNTDDNIKLLCAQSYLYSKVKQLRLRHTGLVIILAALSIVFIFLPDEYKTIPAIIGGVVTLIGVAVESFETSKTKQAAKVQEEFDTNLFNLPWNKVLVGNRVEPEFIRIAERKFSGDKDKMYNWYPDPTPLPYPFDVLVCQRANLVWDSALHNYYGFMLLVICALWVAIGLIVAFLTGQTVTDFFLAWLLPSLPALTLGMQFMIRHWNIAKDETEVRERLQGIWEEGMDNPESITKQHCREIQNCIYNLRCKTSLVPDFVYRYLRDRYETDMRSGADDLRKEAIKKLKLR